MVHMKMLVKYVKVIKKYNYLINIKILNNDILYILKVVINHAQHVLIINQIVHSVQLIEIPFQNAFAILVISKIVKRYANVIFNIK